MDFNLEDRYGMFCQRMANCMFYAAIFPVGAMIAMVGLIITFFVAKNQLVRFCSIPKLSFRLGKLVVSFNLYRIILLPFSLVSTVLVMLLIFIFTSKIPRMTQYTPLFWLLLLCPFQ